MGIFSKTMCVVGVTLFIGLSGCSQKQIGKPVGKDPGVAISCIGVMPVQPSAENANGISYAQAKQLKDGAAVMDALIKKKLAGRRAFRFANSAQAYTIDVGSNPAARLQKVAEQLSCNAMLDITLNRYTDRLGGEYTSKNPASVAFHYKLYDMNQGKVLCSGRFDEKQQSLMENLYNWNRASKRGFTWVTSEELLMEGIHEKFSECAYLADPES